MADMKMKAIGLTLAFCFLAGTTCFAADSQMGTWMLNEAKSKITPGTLKFTTVTFKSMFGPVEVTIKKNGKVTVTARTVVSADGKSRTASVSGTTPEGKRFKNTAVYDKA